MSTSISNLICTGTTSPSDTTTPVTDGDVPALKTASILSVSLTAAKLSVHGSESPGLKMVTLLCAAAAAAMVHKQPCQFIVASKARLAISLQTSLIKHLHTVRYL